jgi:hypothetical protein
MIDFYNGLDKKTYHTKGLDPLGVQAPCINLYGQLLPGITNVTDRARYYSFYPWMVWAFDQLPGQKTQNDFIDWVRRADCLFTMIGVRHRIKTGDNDYLKHDTGLIGTNTLRSPVANLSPDTTLNLSPYAVQEEGNTNRYFKNPLGGLKQYYIGTLDNLGLMIPKGRVVFYTETRGKSLAENLDVAVNRKLFTEIIDKDIVTTGDLDALNAFCPCNLLHSSKEHETLLNTFFDRASEYGAEGERRRQSLGLFLNLIKNLPKNEEANEVFLDHNIFRGCAYTGFLPNGVSWELPPSYDKVRLGWAVYQRNELLSLAVQFIFWISLTCIEEEGTILQNTEDFVHWFSSSCWVSEAIEDLGFTNFDSALKKTISNIPSLSDWLNENHEISMAGKALELYGDHKKKEKKGDILALSAKILLCLMARDDQTKHPYDPMALPTGYDSLYPVNLQSLRQEKNNLWPGMTMATWLAWIAGYWGIEAHLRVALRKLRYQSQDTFHVLPTDKGFVVAAEPDPTYTTPRFPQAIQILQDLGAIERAHSGEWVNITSLGEELLGKGLD